MKKVFIVLSAVVMLASCKKEKSVQPNPVNGNKKLVKFTEPANNFEEIFEYDAAGRVTKADEVHDDLHTFTYGVNTFTMKAIRKSDNNRVVADLSGTLDAKGRMVTVTGIQQYSQNNPQTVLFNYEYNADGYLVKLTKDFSTNADLKYEFSYTNGDLMEAKYFENGVYMHSIIYEYYLDKPEKTELTPHCTLSPQVTKLEGKPNAHLIKNAKLVYANNVQGWSDVFSYDLDAEGYPVKRVISNAFSTWTTFFYY
ncbi:MAG TPA: DUF4595 domain-containing protein [Chitinophagaceae bacterium]|nr:DUF4595 domain-containing protein [Chitinophagaceae bacterium]